MIALADPVEDVAPRLRRTTFAPLAGTGQAAALAHDDGIDVLCTGVGGGKSLVAAVKLLSWIQRHPTRADGLASDWLVIARDVKAVVDVLFKKLLEAETYFSGPLIDDVKRGLGDPQMRMRNGATIYGRSASDPQSYKGLEIEGFWGDEASEWSELAFAMAVSRERAVEGGRLRAILTTNPKDGWIWRFVRGALPRAEGESETEHILEAYAKIREKVAVRVHRWDARRNDAISSEALDGISAILEAAQPDLSRQEVDGLFLGGEVRRSNFAGLDRAFCGELELSSAEARPFVLGLDLGQTTDWTWLVLLGATGVVLEMERLRGDTVSVGPDRFYPHVEGVVLDMCERTGCRLVKLDKAMHGKSFGQSLGVSERARRLGLRVEGYATNVNSRKAEALAALDVAFGRGAVRIPESWIAGGIRHEVAHTRMLRREIDELVIERDGSRITYDHPQGGHDDGVVALALAWQSVSGRAAGPRTWVTATQRATGGHGSRSAGTPGLAVPAWRGR